MVSDLGEKQLLDPGEETHCSKKLQQSLSRLVKSWHSCHYKNIKPKTSYFCITCITSFLIFFFFHLLWSVRFLRYEDIKTYSSRTVLNIDNNNTRFLSSKNDINVYIVFLIKEIQP